MRKSGTDCGRVVWQNLVDVSEEYTASIFRVEE
jgi:hypothetical protein